MKARTHLTWSIEKPDGNCPTCGGPTVLVICDSSWRVDEESCAEAFGKFAYKEEELFRDVEVSEEITGHYCCECSRLLSLSLNTNY